MSSHLSVSREGAACERIDLHASFRAEPGMAVGFAATLGSAKPRGRLRRNTPWLRSSLHFKPYHALDRIGPRMALAVGWTLARMSPCDGLLTPSRPQRERVLPPLASVGSAHACG